MKAKLFLISTLCAAFCVILAGEAAADMIDVKGKGAMTGQIVKEDDRSVTFKDDYGNTIVYAKSEVNFLEKQKKAVLGTQTQAAPEKKEGAAAPVSETKLKGKHAQDYRPAFDDKISAVSDRVSAVGDVVSKKAADFFMGDSESAKEYVEMLSKYKPNDFTRLFQGGNSALAYGGLAVLLIGLLAAIVFGFKLMLIAFTEGFSWGVIFLSNGFFIYIRRYNPSIGALLIVPQLMSLYFILSRWRLVRRTAVIQFFCMDLILLGLVLLKIAL